MLTFFSTVSSNINEVIKTVLNFFSTKFSTRFHTHTLKRHKKVLTSHVSLVHIYKRINLIKHKNAYKQTKTKKAVFLCANKLLRR